MAVEILDPVFAERQHAESIDELRAAVDDLDALIRESDPDIAQLTAARQRLRGALTAQSVARAECSRASTYWTPSVAQAEAAHVEAIDHVRASLGLLEALAAEGQDTPGIDVAMREMRAALADESAAGGRAHRARTMAGNAASFEKHRLRPWRPS